MSVQGSIQQRSAGKRSTAGVGGVVIDTAPYGMRSIAPCPASAVSECFLICGGIVVVTSRAGPVGSVGIDHPPVNAVDLLTRLGQRQGRRTSSASG